MKLYFAGQGYNKILAKFPKSLKLSSFIDKKDLLNYWELTNDKPLFLDSGAFSAFTRGEKIDLDDYIKFIKENEYRLDVYATLDVIGDYKQTEINTQYMLDKGLNPLPIFHHGSPEKELERLCEKYDYIGFGGLVPLALEQKRLIKWLDRAFSIVKDYWPMKIHGLGVNSFKLWKRYPFYSTDATSWLKSVRFGESRFDSKVKNQFYSKKVHYRKRAEQALINYQQKADFVTKVWANKGISWKD